MIQNLLNKVEKKFTNYPDLNNFYLQNIKPLKRIFLKKNILVLGAGGSIAQELIILLIKLKIKKLYIADIDENRLTLVIRRVNQIIDKNTSLYPYLADCSDKNFQKNIIEKDIKKLNYVFNFAAVKHVRSERDISSIKMMINTNCNIPLYFAKQCAKKNIHFFHVSTDKANKPVNMMAATKLIGEKLAFNEFIKKRNIKKYKSARFPNVLFSNGSLSLSFFERILNNEIISIPSNIRRYFISRKQSGIICLLSFVIENNNILTINENYLKEASFKEICYSLFNLLKIQPNKFTNIKLISKYRISQSEKVKKWPVYIFKNTQKNEKIIERLKIDETDKNYILNFKNNIFLSYKCDQRYDKAFNVKLGIFKKLINKNNYHERDYNKILKIINNLINSNLKPINTKSHLDKII